MLLYRLGDGEVCVIVGEVSVEENLSLNLILNLRLFGVLIGMKWV